MQSIVYSTPRICKSLTYGKKFSLNLTLFILVLAPISVLTAQVVEFAMLGDFVDGSAAEADVAAIVNS